MADYIDDQSTLKNSIADCIQVNSTSDKPILADELKEMHKLISSNIKNLTSLQKTIKGLKKVETVDAVSVKSYNQLYLDVELSISESSDTAKNLINEFEDKKVNTVKSIDAIEKNNDKNITCFFPKSSSDIFAISTIYRKFLVYIKENRTVRVSIDEEDFDISIKTPNVQISNNDYTILISRKSNGYEIITTLNVELTNKFNIPKISKDHDFLKFTINAFDFTLSIDNDLLSFVDTDDNVKIEAQTLPTTPELKETLVNPANANTASNLTPEQFSAAVDAITNTSSSAPKHMITENTEKVSNTAVSSEVSTPPAPSALQDNNTLYISDEANKIILPYKISELEKILKKNPKKYTSIDDVIEKEYTIQANQFKNPVKARFKEAYKLIKKKEKGSLKEAIDLGIELMFQSNLNPAIITACKNLNELDIYLNCLDENELDKFNCFEIIYKVPPTKK